MIVKMMADRVGYLKAIEEVRNEWLENLLLFLNIDIQKIHEMDSPTFVHYLNQNRVTILEYVDLNALAVSQDGELVGEWATPHLTLKKEPNGGLYYEIEIEHWSIIEENIE